MNKRRNTLDIWKLVAAFLILGHHASSIGQKGDYYFHGAYVYTEFFFMISGYFMTRALAEGKVSEPWKYAEKTWKKIFPYTAVAMLIYYIATAALSGSLKSAGTLLLKFPLELLYLSELHITSAEFGQLWYVAAMLIMMPLICWIFIKDRQFFKISIFLFPLLWYGYCFSTWGQLGHRGVFIDLIRAATNLLLGGAAYEVVKKINQCKKMEKTKVVVTFIGHMAFLFPILFTYKMYWTQYDFYCIFFFFVALVASQLDAFIDFKLKKTEWLADLSMSIYIVHIPVARYIQRYLGDMTVIHKYELYIGLSIICAIILLLGVKKLLRKKCKVI